MKICALASLLVLAAVVCAQNRSVDAASDVFDVRCWTVSDGLPGNRVTALSKTEDGCILIETTEGTVCFDGVRFSTCKGVESAVRAVRSDAVDRRSVVDMSPLCRLSESNGVEWIGTDGFGLVRMRPRLVIPPAPQRDRNGNVVFCDSSGRTWRSVGTDGVSVSMPDGSRRMFGAREGFGARDVTSFSETPGGDIWVGTNGSGLWRIKESEAVRFHYGDETECENVQALFCDSEGTLWVCAQGDIVSCIRADKSRTVRLGKANGAVALSFHEEPMGRMWLATGDVILSFLASDFKDSSKVPEDGLTVDVFRSSVAIHPPRAMLDGDIGGLSSFDSSEEVSFSYISDSPGLADIVVFSTRLTPAENDWSGESVDLNRSYGKLRPGRYRFEVRARLPFGAWGETAAFSFVVAPPFYQTVPFVAVLLSLLSATILFVSRAIYLRRVRMRLAAFRHRNMLAMERARISRDIHDDVGARLTRISMLISLMAKKNGEAVEIADEVRDVVRALDEVVWAVEPRNDTLSAFADYVYHYAEMFAVSAGIGIRAGFPSDVPDAVVSSVVRHAVYMCVKEALNNAVKHAEATLLFVSMTIDGRRVTVRIGDNGNGFRLPRKGGNGLSNMRTRMEDIGGSFRIGPRPEGGCEVVLEFGLEGKGEMS